MKNVFITGVSRGLGLQILKDFLKEGWNIYCVSRSVPPELKDILINHNNVKHLVYDLENSQGIKSLICKDFISNNIPIHACVHNSAMAYDDIITNLDLNKMNKMMNVNVLSVMMINKYIIRNMLYNKINGSIVHISSISASTGFKGLAMYASTKGCIDSFFNNLSREWGSRGIRSNCVVPGFMETDMTNSLTTEQKKKIYNRTSLKESTDISSVSETVLFLCSEKSRSITGQKIFVDGGVI